MPVYTIKDRVTGKTLDVRGERPPTQEEATALFDRPPVLQDAAATPETLNDKQLIAVAKSGDSSLLRALMPIERDRMIRLAGSGQPGGRATYPRLLSEDEFNAIKHAVMEKAPPHLNPEQVHRYFDPAMAQAIGTAENLPGTPQGSALGRFVSGVWQNLNPLGIIEALVSPDARNQMAIQGGLAMSDQIQKARTAPTRSERIGHGLAAALPFLGPAAANAGDTIASGDYAGGAGQTLGLIAPPFVAEGAMRTGSALRSGGAADVLDRAATQRFVDATAPKVGPNKLRLNRQMAKVAPDALREPELGAFSREGLHAKVQNGLADATAALDEASDARLASQQVQTGPILAALDQQMDRLTARPADASAYPRASADQPAAPLGTAVEPAPNRAQLSTLRQIRSEVQRLGPVAPYEAVRRIREAWDKVALSKYLPSTAADALKSQGEATAAVKGAGAMREALAQTDPASAAAYQKYSLYKSLNDVLAATHEAEQARPRVGRGIMARATGAVAGGASGGTGGAVVGAIVGGIADRAAQLAPTFQIVVARRLAGIADLIRGGDVQAATDAATRLRASLPTGREEAVSRPRAGNE